MDPYSGENILFEFVDGISEDDKFFVFLSDVQNHNAIASHVWLFIPIRILLNQQFHLFDDPVRS
jgi:hypothetical protein